MSQEDLLETGSPLQSSTCHMESVETSSKIDGLGTKTVCSFYLEGKCRFGETCYNLHPAGVKLPDTTRDINTHHKKPLKKKRENQKPEESLLDEKKPSLKTAGDVKKRIQWDPDLPKEYFTVGYLDRFLGVIEKPFTSFTWEHISTVDLDQLAIPQHRIQFFKYKDVKVWDKSERLDHVFGSAGNNTTIHDVIEKIEDELAKNKETFDPDEESDDDDFVVMGQTDDPGGMMAAACQRTQEEQLRATHFFCVRVDNEEVKRAITTVQERVVQEEPILRSCTMPGELLHVTLAMVNFSSPEALLEGINLMQGVQDTLKELLATLDCKSNNLERSIRAHGLSTFGARVLYSPLKIPTSFTTAVSLLHQGLRTIEGAVVTNNYEFVPHMTLLKINRPIARERRSKYINSCLYSEYIDCDFGNIDFNNLHLCVIDDVRDPDGFYVTCKRIEF